MCDPNENNIVSLDFAATADQSNWQTDSTNPLQTVGGKLVLSPSSNSSEFKRLLGTMTPANNRVRIKSNLTVTKQSAGSAEMEILVEVFTGNTKIDESCITLSNLSDGEVYAYYFDRTFDIQETGALTIRITIPEGWQNTLELTDLIVDDFNYCFDNLRTYFVIDGLLEDSLTAMSSGIELLEWKVDEVETLTPAFFAENNVIGGNPLAQWLFAKADLDGSNRVSENTTPNTFNPFVDEFGLEFDTVGSFHGGKPLGTISGSNYGLGILNIGLEKPAVVNGELITKKGAFFIDIDYSKDLKVVFNVLSNQNSTNVFSSPAYFRTYTLEWDSEQCVGTFTYSDQVSGLTVDEANNGFLSGITGVDVNETVVGCDKDFSPSGASGNFSYEIDFGTTIGLAGIDYNAFSVPDRFILEWDGQVFDTGFVGSDQYDAQLIAAGVDPGDINTVPSPGNGSGQLNFNKSTATPTKATVTVLAPLGSTAWNVQGRCPGATPPTVQIQSAVNSANVNQNVTFNLSFTDPDNAIASWVVNFGDNQTVSGTGNPPASVQHAYATSGTKTATLTVTTTDSQTVSDTDTVSINSVGAGSGVNIISNVSDGCFSCWVFGVAVPQGETRQVEAISSFAPSGVYGAGFCGQSDTEIFTDGVVNISAKTNFSLGIDGAQTGGSTGTSTITIIVRDGATVVDTQIFQRVHSNTNC